MLCDRDEEFIVREYRILLDLSIPFDTLESDRKPVGESKVDRFVEVEAMVEARVVSSRESDDEFVRTLIDGVDSTSVLLQMTGTHESDELEEKIGLLIEQLGCGSLHRRFEFLVVFSWDTVPSLRVSEMMVIDAERTRLIISESCKVEGRGRFRTHE